MTALCDDPGHVGVERAYARGVTDLGLNIVEPSLIENRGNSWLAKDCGANGGDLVQLLGVIAHDAHTVWGLILFGLTGGFSRGGSLITSRRRLQAMELSPHAVRP